MLRLIENAMVQVHHLHGSPQPTPDFRGQILSEHRHFYAIGCANVSG